MTKTQLPEYSLAEDITNSITHGIGAAFSVAGLTALVVLATLKGDPWRIVAFSIYGGTLVALYIASTLYHGISVERVRRVFRRLDHGAIYLLIAGTYTPFALVVFHGAWAWFLFITIWVLAAFGVALKAFFTGRFEALSIVLYVGMGWLGVVALKPALAAMPVTGLLWMLAGGLFYTGGLIFYAWDRLPFNHSIWHLCVIAGSVTHFIAIAFFVLP
jgi:hemolysin III